MKRRWTPEASKQQNPNLLRQKTPALMVGGMWGVMQRAITTSPGFCSGCWICGSSRRKSGGGEGNNEFNFGPFQAGGAEGVCLVGRWECSIGAQH